MSLALRHSDYFLADLRRQVDWYRDHASLEIAERYVNAVEAALGKLAETPGLGRPRFRDRPELAGIHSWPALRPYHRHLIFYRYDCQTLWVERIIHGARDLPRRLRQPPYESEE
jgi:toxin ParE1/3/4